MIPSFLRPEVVPYASVEIVRETISCGCCRGPADDRCACWMHRSSTPLNLTTTKDGRRVAKACSACEGVA
jgi:hypothetical protein